MHFFIKVVGLPIVSQERNDSPISSSELKMNLYPVTMQRPRFVLPTPANAEREKSINAAWDQGVTHEAQSSTSYCSRHLRQGCEAHTCTSSSLPRRERSSIGAGLDSRRSRLDIFSDASEDDECRTRMLIVLSDFIRLSALVAPSPPRKGWYKLLAAIITRAVLEGYILHEWTGTRAAQVLFGFGGQNAKLEPRRRVRRATDSDSEDDLSEEEDNEAEFSPDGYVNLDGAYKKLFAHSSSSSDDLKRFRNEMDRRRTEVSLIIIA